MGRYILHNNYDLSIREYLKLSPKEANVLQWFIETFDLEYTLQDIEELDFHDIGD